MKEQFRRNNRMKRQGLACEKTKCNEIFENKWLCLTAVSLFWET